MTIDQVPARHRINAIAMATIDGSEGPVAIEVSIRGAHNDTFTIRPPFALSKEQETQALHQGVTPERLARGLPIEQVVEMLGPMVDPLVNFISHSQSEFDLSRLLKRAYYSSVLFTGTQYKESSIATGDRADDILDAVSAMLDLPCTNENRIEHILTAEVDEQGKLCKAAIRGPLVVREAIIPAAPADTSALDENADMSLSWENLVSIHLLSFIETMKDPKIRVTWTPSQGIAEMERMLEAAGESLAEAEAENRVHALTG